MFSLNSNKEYHIHKYITANKQRYLIRKKWIGRGSFGQIHKAINVKTNQEYALKLERWDNDIVLLKIEYYTLKQI